MSDPDDVPAANGHRRRHPNWAALGALAAVASVVVSIVALYPWGRSDESKTTPGGPVSPTATATGGAGPSPQGTQHPSPGPAPPSTVVLGRDLQASETKPCGSPVVAAGGAWQTHAAWIGGREHDTAYTCNLFSGFAGSLRFVLGRSFRSLHASVGFADESAATDGTVRFELIGDGRVYLTPPVVLKFGDVRDLDMDVADITQLEVRVTELSQSGSMQSPSNPALAMALAMALSRAP